MHYNQLTAVMWATKLDSLKTQFYATRVYAWRLFLHSFIPGDDLSMWQSRILLILSINKRGSCKISCPNRLTDLHEAVLGKHIWLQPIGFKLLRACPHGILEEVTVHTKQMRECLRHPAVIYNNLHHERSRVNLHGAISWIYEPIAIDQHASVRVAMPSFSTIVLVKTSTVFRHCHRCMDILLHFHNYTYSNPTPHLSSLLHPRGKDFPCRNLEDGLYEHASD